MSNTPHPRKRRISDAKALAALSSAARKLIKARGWVRCLREPNSWHAADPIPDATGIGACRCRVRP
jgi:hypothetical protein